MAITPILLYPPWLSWPRMGRTTIQVSEELADELHDRKSRGESYEDVVWRLIEASEGPSSPSEPQGKEAEDTPKTPTTPDSSDKQAVDRQALVDALPGSGDLAEARADEILKMYDQLREHGEAEKDDLLAVVDVEATQYASLNSVWSNMVKGRDTLRELPGVEKPSTGLTTWRYSP